LEMALWTIQAKYDPEARVWYSIEGDVPGLFVDAATIDKLAEKAGPMLLDLIEIHADEIPVERREGPHTIRIVAHDERAFDVAA
jgi:hypothetical protein